MNEKILIIDDEESICDLLRRFLEGRGYNVFTAKTAKEGIRKLRAVKPAVILLDIVMPSIDGLKALKLMKRIDKDVDVIMATGVVDQDMAEKTRDLGAVEYILKPFDLDYLKSVILWRLTIKGKQEV